MSSPLLPKQVDLDLDCGTSIASQIRAAIEARRGIYAWFRALDEEQLDELVERLVRRTEHRITHLRGHDSAIRADRPRRPRIELTLSFEELRRCCEEVLPSERVRAMILEEIDLPHIFGDTREDERIARYSKLFVERYPRSGDAGSFDPDGRLFLVDLPHLLSISPESSNELEFVAFGCHGTGAATLKNLEGKTQLFSIIWRGIAGRQKAVGEEIVRWMLAKKEQGKLPFGFVLGDNFYESGVPNVEPRFVDELFERAFIDIYGKRPGRAGGPLGVDYFGALGNHDYNFHGHAVLPSDGSQFASNLDRALAQVDFTYRGHRSHGWHLPYRYYCVASPVANFFVIDTSTFLFDKRQQTWLREAYAKLAATRRWSFLMAHHGLVTFGKRGAGHHAERDLGELARTEFTAQALKDRERGRTGASEASVLGAAAVDLRDNVNRHIFTWFAREGMHFHFNVVAHDHFLASALLTYDTGPGAIRRTYYVLSGGGGAWPGNADVEALARLGPSLSNVDLLEKKYGFATFKVTRDTAEVSFRFVDGKKAADAWGGKPQVFRLDDTSLWSPSKSDASHERLVRPAQRDGQGFFRLGTRRERLWCRAMTVEAKPGWRVWMRRLVPYALTGAIVFAILRQTSPSEIAAQMREGHALAMFPLAIALMIALLALVSIWDGLVIRGSLGKPRYRDVLRGKAGTSLLMMLGYGFGHGAYGFWIARMTGCGGKRAGGIVLYLVASDLAAVGLAASLAMSFAGDLVPTWLRVVAPMIGVAMLLAIVLGPALLARASSPPPWLDPFRLLPRSTGFAQLAGRMLNMALGIAMTWLGARVFGLEIPFLAMAAYLPVILVVASLPINVGGLGAAQAVWLVAFDAWASDAQILAFQLLWQLMSGIGLVLRGLPFVRRVIAEIEEGKERIRPVQPA